MNKKEELLLEELNRIICLIDNGYLWRELSGFDLELRIYFTGKDKVELMEDDFQTC